MPKYGINKVTLLGNVGTAPEIRYLDQGVAVCNFRLATTERQKAREGQWTDRTDWHNIVLWRQKAELAHKYLKVGSGLYVEGRIVTRSWDGPDGQKRFKTEIEVEKMRFLDGIPETGSGQGAGSANPPATSSPQPPAQDGPDDLPF